MRALKCDKIFRMGHSTTYPDRKTETPDEGVKAPRGIGVIYHDGTQSGGRTEQVGDTTYFFNAEGELTGLARVTEITPAEANAFERILKH